MHPPYKEGIKGGYKLSSGKQHCRTISENHEGTYRCYRKSDSDSESNRSENHSIPCIIPILGVFKMCTRCMNIGFFEENNNNLLEQNSDKRCAYFLNFRFV